MSPAQSRVARDLLGLTQKKLAEMSGLSVATILDFEREVRPISNAVVASIQVALESAGAEFLPEGAGWPNVRLRKPTRAATIPVENLSDKNDE
jgi:transcriptional regulator with XRE-family HTH domain